MKFTLMIVLLVAWASDTLAETRRVRPDGHIQFAASMDGPTRISVQGDRIKDVIQTDSQFEMANDEGTGDIFLRYVGDSEDPESGYLITEAGHTIGFKMTPRKSLEHQTILVQLVGVKTAASQAKQANEAAGVSESGFAVSDGGSDSYAGSLTQIVKELVATKIGRRSAAKYKSGATVGSLRKAGLSARGFAVAVKSGTRPAPQSFYNSRTLAVWVDDVIRGGKVWVVTVEKRK